MTTALRAEGFPLRGERARDLSQLALITSDGVTDLEPVARMALQPIVDLTERAVLGYEALARFGAAGTGKPGPVLAAAAAAGRTNDLEAVLLEVALGCRSSLENDQYLAVNVSPAALLTRRVDAVLRDAGDLSDVVLEVTEHDVTDVRALRRRLDVHREAGARIALDDTGAGHAGLRRILELEPDIIKVDRVLVRDIDSDPARRAVLASLVRLADELGAVLLAEGVETPAELRCLHALGVTVVQGFLVGRPTLRRHELHEAAMDHLPRASAAMTWLEPRPVEVDLPVATFAELRLHTTAAGSPSPSAPLHDLPLADVPACPSTFSAALVMANRDVSTAVVTESDGRPLELLLGNAPGSPTRHTPTVARASASPRELFELAMMRGADERWLPLVVVGDDGALIGLLTVESLAGVVHALG